MAKGSIKVNSKIRSAIVDHTVEKGDVLGMARVAGILGSKQASSLFQCAPHLTLASAE